MNRVSTSSVVVFLGPSCDGDRARSVLQADYRAPARRGDVARAAAEGARTIVLIDGCLVYDYPPSPMEIAEVIAENAIVVGAASLGALRGVELRHLGMKAIGWVFERYLDGTIVADDEVVVRVDPRTGAAASLALVRIRYAVTTLVRLGVLDPVRGQSLIDGLREVYFEDRTRACLGAIAADLGLPPGVVEQILAPELDVKALDTIACLCAIADGRLGFQG